MTLVTILSFWFSIRFLKLEVINVSHIFIFTWHSNRNSRCSEDCQIIFLSRKFESLSSLTSVFGTEVGLSRSYIPLLCITLQQESSITATCSEHFLVNPILPKMLALSRNSVLLNLLYWIDLCGNRHDHLGMFFSIMFFCYSLFLNH